MLTTRTWPIIGSGGGPGGRGANPAGRAETNVLHASSPSARVSRTTGKYRFMAAWESRSRISSSSSSSPSYRDVSRSQQHQKIKPRIQTINHHMKEKPKPSLNQEENNQVQMVYLSQLDNANFSPYLTLPSADYNMCMARRSKPLWIGWRGGRRANGLTCTLT